MRPRLWGALLARESRGARGRLAFFVACLALGVGAVTGVAALSRAVQRGVSGDSRALLAGDLSFSSRHELPDALLEELRALPGAEVVELRELATMAAADAEGGSSRLVELRAADAGHPLYGALETDPPGLDVADLADDEVLASPELLAALGLAVGDGLRVGGEAFTVRGALLDEPDRLEISFTLGPRVLATRAGLARTDLVQFGSRVRYTALVRVGPDASDRELDRLERRLDRVVPAGFDVRSRTHHEVQPRVRRQVERVERYLGLLALLSLLLGGIGVAQVVRAWVEERTDAVAVLRSLGLRPREILALYVGHVLLLALVACALGCAAGLALPLVAAWLAPELVPEGAALGLPLGAVLRGTGLGLGAALLFAWAPLTAVYRVPPARVVRAEAAPLPAPRAVRWLGVLAVAAGAFLAAWLQSGELDVAAVFCGVLLAVAALLHGAARGTMRLVAALPRERADPYLRHGLAALARPGAGTTAAVVALGLGVLVVATMLLVEGRLGRELRGDLPDDAPTVFLVDVQPGDWPGVRRAMEEQGGEQLDSTPVVMARLAAIDGTPVDELARGRGRRGRGRWVLTREQRLTWRAALPDSNRLVEGRWFGADPRPEVSLERGFAEDLGAGLGTELTFDVQGVPVDVVVTSLREVDWASFAINFFLIVEPGVLEDAPHFRLAAGRFPPEREQPLQDALARGWPNVTVLRVRPILEKIGALLGRVALGVRVLGLAAVGAGLAILAGAVGASGLRRAREAALLKTLGVTRAGVALLFALEHGLVGALAGTFGALGAYALSWAFLERLLELDAELSWGLLPALVLGSALLSAICGLAASGRALAVRPVASLR